MNKLDKATGEMDVIDVLDSFVDSVKRKNQMKAIIETMDSAIDALSKKKQATPSGYQTTIEINGWEFDCIVDYEYIRGCRGSRNEYGVPMEPDEQPYIEMGEVWIFDSQWNVVDIPEKAMKDTLDEILEEYNV